MSNKERDINISEESFTMEDLTAVNKLIMDARLDPTYKCVVEDLYGEVSPLGAKKAK